MSVQSFENKHAAEMVNLGPGTYAFIQDSASMGSSNAGVIVGDKYVAIIDTLNSVSVFNSFMDQIKNITDRAPRFVILTHSHPDHIWGNHLLLSAVSICHKYAYDEMIKVASVDMSQMKKAFEARQPDSDAVKVFSTFPDILVGNHAEITIGDRIIELKYYGFAHSLGDMIAYLPQDGIVFCGDLLFEGSTPMGFSGLFSGWIKALQEISKLNAGIYVPGHGRPCGKKELLDCLDYLVLVFEQSKKAYGAGLTYQEAAEQITLGHYKSLAEPERILGNVARVYHELSGKVPEDAPDITAIIMETRNFKYRNKLD